MFLHWGGEFAILVRFTCIMLQSANQVIIIFIILLNVDISSVSLQQENQI